MLEAYCGPAPTLSDAFLSWNADPAAILLCGALIGLRWLHKEGDARPLHAAVFLLAVLYLTPLCALTVALFAVRVLHHVLLVAVAAPLLALAFPAGRARLSLGWLVALHAMTVWLWHIPDVYSFAIGPALPYWTMQATLLLTGFALWRVILAPTTNPGAAVLALLATAAQMGMLGALLTFATEPLYEPHLSTTIPFGLSALQDQQLAGLIMWVPGGIVYLLVVVVLFVRWLEELEGRMRHKARHPGPVWRSAERPKQGEMSGNNSPRGPKPRA
jgi:putative membrane protein